MSFPPPTTERAPRETERAHEPEGEEAEHQVGEEDRPTSAAANDVDQGEVDDAQHHRVEDQPELAQRRVEVLRAQVRAGELVEELAARPERPEVRAERRQPDLVRLVDVVVAAELVALAASVRPRSQWALLEIHRVQISRSGRAFLHLRRPDARIATRVPDDGDPCRDGEGDDENPASVEAVRERIDDRRGEREDRGLDRLEGPDRRQEPRSWRPPPRPVSGRGRGPVGSPERVLDEVRLRLEEEDEHRGEEAESRPAADRVPAAVRAHADRSRDGGLGRVVRELVEVDADAVRTASASARPRRPSSRGGAGAGREARRPPPARSRRR